MSNESSKTKNLSGEEIVQHLTEVFRVLSKSESKTMTDRFGHKWILTGMSNGIPVFVCRSGPMAESLLDDKKLPLLVPFNVVEVPEQETYLDS